MVRRCIVSIAVGKVYYLRLAENLLRSFQIWNDKNDLHFLLVTDSSDYFEIYNNIPYIHIKVISLDESDRSFTSKFKIFEHIIAEENIFIDADCLIYRELDGIFDLFKGKNFSAIGNNITEGNFFGDVKAMMKKFDLNGMPKFVGSVYFFRNNSIAKRIFEKASELKSNYDALDFVRLAGKENEEPLLAVAMAMNKETLVPNDGTAKCDLMYYKNITSNILRGIAFAENPILAITCGEEIPKVAHPAILHFNDVFTEHYYYQSELFRLDHSNYNKTILELLVLILFTIPGKSMQSAKKILRPIYRFIWGYRNVRKRNRRN